MTDLYMKLGSKILKVLKDDYNENTKVHYVTLSDGYLKIYKDEEFKSKTEKDLKKLIDGYYVKDKRNRFKKYNVHENSQTDFEYMQLLKKEYNREIYGFIERPNGLIFVVKMNDEGELELL